ncbi:MAG: NAD-glutamate dehydrogenase [Pseudomonadota bacterium]|nr:NAD-glutamate dehydrogenase [Pseudomonadota bacterium]
MFVASSDDPDINRYPPRAIAALLLSAWEFAATRETGKHKIRLFNPENITGPHGDATVIEIVNDDMPFLLDSIMGEIQERGLGVHLVLHPVLAVNRDARGRLKDVGQPGNGEDRWTGRESYIHIHVQRLSDKQALEELKKALSGIVDNVRTVVRDWRPMLDRLNRAVAAYTSSPPPVPVSDLAESIQFLKWLLDNNFIFLGMRAFAFVGGAQRGKLEPIQKSGLGILRDPDVYVLRRGNELVHWTPEIRQFFLQPAPLIVAKANVRSSVHRRAHMDYIGVKIYGDNGEISGELRIVGLFTSTAYTRSVRSIPFLRHKAELVMNRSGYAPNSHSAKALQNVIETFPRDELFQIDVDYLYDVATAIQSLELRPRARAFARIDRFDRFVSILVFVPRDRFSTEVRQRIGEFLAESYKGRVSAFYPFFPEGPMVRIHFIIGRYEGKTPQIEQTFLERQIAEIVRTWSDRLGHELRALQDLTNGENLARKYAQAFPVGYEANFEPSRAVLDIERLEKLTPEHPVAVDFYGKDGDPTGRIHVAIYHLQGSIPLSRRVPVLENLGFSVIDERSYMISPHGQDQKLSLHDMILETQGPTPVDLEAMDGRLESAFLAVWRGDATSDSYNRLVLAAGMDWREAAVLRGYGSYLRQIGAPFGQAYLAETLVRHLEVARNLMEMFRVRFDPDRKGGEKARKSAEEALSEAVDRALDAVPSLDEDRILRHFRNLIRSSLRTNFYKRDDADSPPPAIAIKLDSKRVDGAPSPRPFAEIIVFCPRVEGLHLRGGRIARGGLRWSDRLQDYRTEILGLAKAQQVKNVVIVPTGSKGGFVPKWLPSGGTREQVMEEGIAAYRLFISMLLSVTDNLDGAKVIPPERVVRHDGDDPYLVVAADKGTATFSDFANEISVSHNFWLGDAFDSGGSAGYDHKKMGITARGGWEAVKRHFREMDTDIQSTPFTVIGVGDMSGDVFGNGMLLSKQIRLLAAFDHRDIFIDPDPDPQKTWVERKRLFDLPRSSWQDYNAKLISKGGGVFPRSLKSIPLSNEIRAMTGLDAAAVTPAELMRAILKSSADLLWFGGIGTYVAASGESPEQVGDRANDAIRVKASDLRVKAVGEGANLGVTQRGRIEFAMAGGRVNTDAIDNSAGVNSSDQEVNIKLALGAAVAAGKLDITARNKFLARMTEDVAAACLRNNYLQTLALSLGQRRGLADLGFQARLMRSLETDGLLDREVELLPDDNALEVRREQGQPLTRPELAVLLAYAKIDVYNELIASSVPDDPYFETELRSYFPKRLQEAYPDEIAKHRLRREIIATQLSNAIINRGGSTMFVRLKEETGHTASAIAAAYVTVAAVFDLEPLFDQIDALDNKISGSLQLDLYLRVQGLLRQETGWFLRHARFSEGLTKVIAHYRDGIVAQSKVLSKVLSGAQLSRFDADRGGLEAAGVPPATARRLAELRFLAGAPDAVLCADATGKSHDAVARIHADAIAHFRIDELRTAAEEMLVTDYFDRLAINAAMASLSGAVRGIVQSAVREKPGEESFEAWRQRHDTSAARARRSIDEVLDGSGLTLARLTVAVGHLGALAPA